MTLQPLDQVLPLLELIQQPAFCLGADGQITANGSAKVLAPFSQQALPQWLGDAWEAFEAWDRTSDLILPVELGAETVSCTIRPLADGLLFLLAPCPALTGNTEMTVTAQVLRQPLNELVALAQELGEEMEELEDPYLQRQTASLTRQLYRLTRITCDMADLEQLCAGTYPIHPEKLDLRAALLELEPELEDLCRAAGHSLTCRLPRKPLTVVTDWVLLERALLNLLSNAMKYGAREAPLELLVDATEGAVHFKIRNLCAKDAGDLLTAAFRRLTKRDLLPDPRWGAGLGLPLALAIARLLGGAMAVDVDPKNRATVSMSITRKQARDGVTLQNAISYDYSGGMRRTLMELSDSLPDICYDSTVI